MVKGQVAAVVAALFTLGVMAPAFAQAPAAQQGQDKKSEQMEKRDEKKAEKKEEKAEKKEEKAETKK